MAERNGSTPAWAREELALRDEMALWTQETAERQQGWPWVGVHDEGSFLSSWFGFYALTGDREVRDHLYYVRDGYLAWADERMVHGYYPEGEAHHEIETYVNYLANYWQLEEERETDLGIVEDVAHHAGNWVDGIPEWYDWEQHRFRSYWLGTREVRDYPPCDIERPDHARFVRLCINAYLGSGNDMYLDLVSDYATTWSRIILEETAEHVPPFVRFPISDPDRIAEVYFPGNQNLPDEGMHYGSEKPGAMGGGWTGFYQAATADRGYGQAFPYWARYGAGWEAHREDYGAAIGKMYEVVRALTEAGVVMGEERYKEAARRMIDLAERLGAGRAAGWMAEYRAATKETRYDGSLSGALGTPYHRPTAMVLEGMEQPHPTLRWAYRDSEGAMRDYDGPSAGALVTDYQLGGDVEALSRAFEMARGQIHIARRTLRDGREHGCVGYYTQGPGGQAGSALNAATMGLYKFACMDRRAVRYAKGDGSEGLPEGVAAACRMLGEDRLHVRLYNANAKETAVRVRPDDTDRKVTGVRVDGEPGGDLSPQEAAVWVGAEAEVEVELELG